MKQVYSEERIEQIVNEVPHRSFLDTDELHSIIDYCKANGMTDYQFKMSSNAIYYGTLAAFAIGFRRGRNYQKRQSKK